MKSLKRKTVAILLISFARVVGAAESIDVLVAVTPSAVVHGANVFSLTSVFENNMEITLDGTGSGLQNRDMNFYAYPIPTTYVGDALEGSSAEAAYDALSLGQDNALAVAREGLIPYSAPGFDLVVVVGHGFEIQSGPFQGALVCGWASDPIDFNNPLNSENQAWLILNADSTCVQDFQTWIIPHEFGHMLGSNHQITGGIGDDTAPSFPVTYNHPVLETFGFTPVATPLAPNLAFLKRQYSNPDLGNFPGTSIPAGSSVEDNAKLFVEDTWGMVAAYRPIPPPPPACDPVVTFSFCNNYSAVWSISSHLPGYEILNGDFDISINGTGPWIDIFEGISNCPSASVNLQTSALARVILDTAFGTSSCTAWIPNYDCEQNPF